MKKRLFPAMLLAATLGVVGCADKDLDGIANSTEDSGKYAYFNAAISLPSSSFTRSQTDGDSDGTAPGETNSNADKDFEEAYDYESDVRSMILVITNKYDEYLVHSVVPSIAPVGGQTNPTYMVNSKIPYDVLEKAYFKGTEGGNDKGILEKTKETDGSINVNLYAFCNYTSDILAKFDEYAANANRNPKAWIDWAGTVEEGPAAAGKTKPTITNTIWAKRSFLMTNYENYQSNKFPKDIDGWDEFSNQSNALDLTKSPTEPLKVERVAARFDFKDGSKKQKVDENGKIVPVGDDNNNNTYQLWTAITTTSTTPSEGEPSAQEEGEEEEGEGGTTTTTTTEIKNYFSVTLTRMALVNMSKEFYYLRRVSDNGLGKDLPTPNNWAVGGYEYWKNEGTPESPKYKYNYVVDTDAADKQEVKGINPENAEKHFNFSLYSEKLDGNGNYPYARDAWYADNIDDVLGTSGKTNPEGDKWNNKSDYCIWRYVTENTIPQSKDSEHPESQQKTIQSTGIVFKGAIVAGDNLDDSNFSEKVKEALNVAAGKVEDKNKETYDYPILYSFDNILYAGMEELIENAYKEGENSPFYQALDNILTKHWEYTPGADGKVTYKFSKEPIDVEEDLDGDADDEARAEAHENDLTVTLCHYILNKDTEEGEKYQNYSVELTKDIETEFCNLVPKQNITVYEATDEEDGAGRGYYCYYFYWNRHNDNEKSGKMGPMEFAVVRNNVYKLAVTSISQLGHPRDTNHDPEPITPETPDEDPTRYIKVDVQVLPWVVRVNNIEF